MAAQGPATCALLPPALGGPLPTLYTGTRHWHETEGAGLCDGQIPIAATRCELNVCGRGVGDAAADESCTTVEYEQCVGVESRFGRPLALSTIHIACICTDASGGKSKRWAHGPPLLRGAWSDTPCEPSARAFIR